MLGTERGHQYKFIKMTWLSFKYLPFAETLFALPPSFLRSHLLSDQQKQTDTYPANPSLITVELQLRNCKHIVSD